MSLIKWLLYLSGSRSQLNLLCLRGHEYVSHLAVVSVSAQTVICLHLSSPFLQLPFLLYGLSPISVQLLNAFCHSFCFHADQICLCLSASPRLCVRVCILSISDTSMSVSSLHLSQGSPSLLLPLPPQRAALPFLLCFPAAWPFTASAASTSTAANLLTKACSRTTGKGRSKAWLQWVQWTSPFPSLWGSMQVTCNNPRPCLKSPHFLSPTLHFYCSMLKGSR